MKRRSLLAALAVSVLLHGVALVWASLQPPPPEVRPAAEPIEVVVLTQEEPPAPAPSAPEAAAAPPAPAPRAERPPPATPRPPPARVPQAQAPTPDKAVQQEAAPKEAPAAHAPRLDALEAPPAAPRALTLVPGGDFAVPEGLARGGAVVAAPSGRTIRPGDEESEASRLARQGARVKERVETWSTDQLAERRVQYGLLDPYFSELRHALDAEVKTPPKELKMPPALQQMVGSYLSQLQRYGATGAPGVDVPVGERRDVSSSSVSHVLEREAARDPSLYKGGFMVAPGQASPEAMAQRAALSVEVELRVAPDGTLAGKSLLRSSGDPIFDRFVMGAMSGALTRLAPPPQGGSGVHPDGVRVAYEIRGEVTLKKKVRDFKLPQDLPYLTAALGLGQLAGSFDVSSMKDMEVVDVRDPRWKLSSRLLRVY